MALETKPKGNRFISKEQWLKGPPGAHRYRVRNGDSWTNLARRDQWAYTWDLIKYNFPTDDPREINWYLREYVGCNLSRDGGKNWSFSNSASPGFVFTKNDLEAFAKERIPSPDSGPINPDDEYQGKLFDSGWWFGFGVKGGLTTPDLRGLGLPIPGVGVDVAVMQMVSLESLLEFKDGIAGSFTDWNRFVLNIDALRYDGKGLGGGGIGLVFCAICGINTPSELRGYRVEGEDFGISVGPFKSKYLQMIDSMAPLFKSLGKNFLKALKSPDAWNRVADIAKIMRNHLDLEKAAGKTTSIQVYDTPISLAAETTHYAFSGMTQVLLANYRTPQKRWEDRRYPDR